MRRIDLVCKLCGPLFISLVNGASTKVGIFLILGLNLASIPIEYITVSQVRFVLTAMKIGTDALQVYHRCASLQRSRTPASNPDNASENMPTQHIPCYVLSFLINIYRPLSIYVTSPTFLLSFSLSLLYLTVLSFSGQMITYLSIPFQSSTIGGLRTASTIFELSATWLAPRLMKRIHPARAGAWFLNWQFISLLPGVVLFWNLQGGGEGKRREMARAGALVASTIASRVGLWGFDLCAQFIIQDVSDSM